MTNEVLVKQGATQILFADHATDFGADAATAANSLLAGSQTDVQIDLTGLAASGGARHSAKFDYGATRAAQWALMVCLEFEAAPTDGGFVSFYNAPSPNATAANGNPGGVTGSDAGFTDTLGILGQFDKIGSILVRNNVINIGFVGLFLPSERYGSLVVVNNADQTCRSTATAMDETHAVLTPVIDEIQAAA